MTRYADGKGGTYDLPSQINTYLCGGTIYPSTGSGGSQTPAPAVKKLTFKSTHTKITKDTYEILSFYATGLIPNATYQYTLMVKSAAFNNGAETPIYQDLITARGDGSYLWEQERTDDGVTTPRGDYETWVVIESANLTSNKIVRSYIAGKTPTDPDDKENAGGGAAGGGGKGGVTNPDINGDEYGHPGQYWPPVAPYMPRITYSADRGTMFVGTNEVQTVELRNFYANTAYVMSFWTKHPEVSGGAAVKTAELTITTSSGGRYQYTTILTDDGTLPRGMAES